MKKYITTLLMVLLTCTFSLSTLFAQSPEKMSYQAVVRDASNDLIKDTQIGMQISILQTSASGTAVYVETQTPTTNTNGLVTIEIGGAVATVVSGDFSTIDWSAGPYFIKTETDPAGGTSYTITGTSQLLSVPYALHAKSAESIKGDAKEYVEDLEYRIFDLEFTGGKDTIADNDGNYYKIVKIGDQYWMAENLRTTTFFDNTSIPNVEDTISWDGLTTSAFCWNYNDAATYEVPYGKFYNWHVINAGEVCPEGWHVSTDNDYSVLISFLGSSAGGKMKEAGTAHWSPTNTGATNESGFTGLPGIRGDNGEFHPEPGKHGGLWTATEYNSTEAWYRRLDRYDSTVDHYQTPKNAGAYIRCVKD